MAAPIYSNLGTVNTALVKAGPVFLYSFTCYNANAADRWLMLFDLAAVPSNTAIPTDQYLVPAGQQIGRGSDVFTDLGLKFSDGLCWAFSTTKNALTLGTAADQATEIRYA